MANDADDTEQPNPTQENPNPPLPYKGEKRGPKPLSGRKTINWKRRQIVDAMPGHNWSIMKAAISCGYSKNYARTHLLKECANDIGFLAAVEAKRKEVAELAPWNLEELQRQYRKLLDECNEAHDRANAKGVLDSLTRTIGGFLDRQQVEDPAKSRELEEKEQEEARRIAQIRLREVG